MSRFYDELETRSDDARAAVLATTLPDRIARAQFLAGNADRFSGVDPATINSINALGALPVLRKTELVELQRADPPFGGLTTRQASEFDHVHQSPGPIYEPGMRGGDWWRFGRFLHAAGIGAQDIV